MERIIEVTIKDKVASCSGSRYVCGNSDYVIHFDFDDEWTEFETKTARFKCKKGYVDVVFSGDVCSVPVITDVDLFSVGVYAGNIHTTTPAYVRAYKSILSGDTGPYDPPDDVYHQIMDMLNHLKEPAAVLYTSQSLTEEQKEQARANIGAGKTYTLPQASSYEIGGVKADAAEATDTQPVRIGEDGKLYTAPGGGVSGDYIPIPASAEVGQTIVVKAVDENGKPTEWEAVDLPNNEKFIVTFSGDGSHYVCDKTMDEIVNAYENGQDISAYFTGFAPNGSTYSNLLLSLTMYDPGMYIEFGSDIELHDLCRIRAFIDGTGYCDVFEDTALDNSLTNDSMAANAKAVGDALARKQDTLIQSGAAIGQIAKITAVDSSGKPTAWEAVDMPGGNAMPIIQSYTISDSDVMQIDFTDLNLSEFELVIDSPKITGTAVYSSADIYLNGLSSSHKTLTISNYAIYTTINRRIIVKATKNGGSAIFVAAQAIAYDNEFNKTDLYKSIGFTCRESITEIHLVSTTTDRYFNSGSVVTLRGREAV